MLASTPAAALAIPRSSLSHGPAARPSRALRATDTADLRYIKHTGALLLEEGAARGTLPGSMRAYCNVGGTFTASFTFYLKGGTIKGHGTATPHGSGIYESFSGTLTVTGGTGRYSNARGHAGLYGTFNRRTYALVVQTTGSLSY
jgi:hypothetical protein